MIVTLAQVKEQIGWTDDMGSIDDDLLTRKIEAAQDHIDRLLGFKIEETFGGQDQDPVPSSLVEAVSQLAAHWYEQRETAIAGQAMQPIPFGVWEIVTEYREWEF